VFAQCVSIRAPDILHGHTSFLLAHRAHGYRRFGEPASFTFSTERSQFQGNSIPNCTASHRTRLCLLHMYVARHCTVCVRSEGLVENTRNCILLLKHTVVSPHCLCRNMPKIRNFPSVISVSVRCCSLVA
jgi:hypothetical protein